MPTGEQPSRPPASADRLVAKLARLLEERRDVDLALLFGSWARGRPRSGSDIDLAVRGDRPDLLAIGGRIGAATGLDADVVDLDRVDYPLLKAIHREGRVVYRKDVAAEATWRTRTLLHIETDEPFFARMREAFIAGLAEKATTHGRS